MTEFETNFNDLFEDYTKKLDKLNTKFYVTWDKLQKSCKHEKTHWMQELDKNGNYKGGLFKRCFDCGVTVTKIDGPDEVIESALKAFDDVVEASLCVDLMKGENKK
jgi:hypothetical protein